MYQVVIRYIELESAQECYAGTESRMFVPRVENSDLVQRMSPLSYDAYCPPGPPSLG